MKLPLLLFVATCTWAQIGNAVTPPLEQLLEKIRITKQQEAETRQQRKVRFLEKKENQKELLNEIEARLKAEQKKSEKLKALFQINEDSLAALEEELLQNTGDLGEVFGTVRQSAKDLATTVKESPVSAQHYARSPWLINLSERKKLPTTEELNELWFLMQQEIVESGRVAREPATVINAEGLAQEKSIIRIGLFGAIVGSQYLKYQPESGHFIALPRQPSSAIQEIASKFSRSNESYAELSVDPTRGVLLGMLMETPSWLERVRQGGVIGYIILAFGGTGLLIVLIRITYLAWVGGRIRRQLTHLLEPTHNNPLGRVLVVAEENRELELENLELKIDEAVLKEIPKLTRGEGLVKLLAGVAPLLGLLGTVVGMIITFQAISLFGTGDPKLMANGISQALVTTALGLIVAIPLLFLHSLLTTRSRSLVQILDEQSTGLVAMSRELK